MNNELEKSWKDQSLPYFKESRHSSRGTEKKKTTQNLCQDSRSPGRGLKPEPPEYEAEC
jgi:hypothetical protein